MCYGILFFLLIPVSVTKFCVILLGHPMYKSVHMTHEQYNVLAVHYLIQFHDLHRTSVNILSARLWSVCYSNVTSLL